MIGIERNALAKLDLGYEGAWHTVSLLAHEYCHNDETEFHDFDFYHLFHTMMMDSEFVARTVNALLSAYDDRLAKLKLKASAKHLTAMKSIRRDGISKTQK